MKVIKLFSASGLFLGACGIIIDPVITLLHSKKLRDDGGAQLSVCEVLNADAKGRPTFAVAQTLFSMAVGFSAVTIYEKKYVTIAIWAYINVLLELVSYGTPYSDHQLLHVGMNCITYTSALVMNLYTVVTLKDRGAKKWPRQFYVAAIIFAGLHFFLVGSDAIFLWSKNYYSFFILEMTGLYSYCMVQILFCNFIS